ncbi:hypothetical protein [Aeromonas caviae]|nr:hypothetical protein [Aeromonas caviae]
MMRSSNTFDVLLIYLLTFSICIQFDYFFDGASRYIPLRIITLVIFVYVIKNVISDNLYNKRHLFLGGAVVITQLIYLIVWTRYYTDDLLSRTIGNFIYVVGFSYLFFSLCEKCSPKVLINVLKSGTCFFTLLLLVETCTRFMFPTLDITHVDATEKIARDVHGVLGGDLPVFEYFYSFKYSSIMFFDSNYVGLMGLLMVYTIRYMKWLEPDGRMLSVMELLSFIIVVLSFSRSAIFSMLILYIAIIYISFRSTILRVNLFILSLAFLSLGLFIWGNNININDGSFETKLEILKSLYNKYDSIDFIQLLLGAGPVVGGYVFSYKDGAYAHSLIPLVLGEMGLVGVCLLIVIYCYIVAKIKRWGGLFIIITFLPGLSLIDPYQIMYVWVVALIIYTKDSKKYNDRLLM